MNPETPQTQTEKIALKCSVCPKTWPRLAAEELASTLSGSEELRGVNVGRAKFRRSPGDQGDLVSVAGALSAIKAAERPSFILEAITDPGEATDIVEKIEAVRGILVHSVLSSDDHKRRDKPVPS